MTLALLRRLFPGGDAALIERARARDAKALALRAPAVVAPAVKAI